MAACHAGLSAVCLANQRSSSSLCLTSLAPEKPIRSTVKQAWCAATCIRLGLLAWVHRTGTAALTQGMVQPLQLSVNLQLRPHGMGVQEMSCNAQRGTAQALLLPLKA